MTIITTTHSAPEPVISYAKSRAAVLGLPFLSRFGNMDDMKSAGAEAFLIYGKRGVSFRVQDNEYFYHTGTAAVRILELSRGGRDRLCALLPEGTKSVLDCTYGEGKDSLVFSYFLGNTGRVTALEKSTALYEIGRDAIENYQDKNSAVTEAIRRIRLLHEDMKDFLEKAETGAFDVVYIDTMFRAPVNREIVNIEAFRAAASPDMVTGEIYKEAFRVASRAVIVKERPFSQVFKQFSFSFIDSKHGQTTAYGVARREM